MKTHPPPSKIDMDEIDDVMKKIISPTIDNQLKIDSSNTNKFPDIENVLTNQGAQLTCVIFYCRW
jgi:hypothetical protein